MTYQEALAIIHQTPWQNHKPGLKRIKEFMELMGNPQDKVKFIHIAGSNGKGSTAAIIASVLQAAGYRTGLATSPYISCFNERMQVDSRPITDDEICMICEKALACSKKMSETPTEFEFVNAITFEFFASRKCDIAVLEVGLGGRLDATNIIKPPIAAVITAIGLEHTELLGDTVEKIAVEKAGIIKTGSTAVISCQPQPIIDAVEQVCKDKKVELKIANQDKLKRISQDKHGQLIEYNGIEKLHLPLLGSHQLQNLAAALSAIEVIREKGFSISAQAVKSGVEKVKWCGRFELMQNTPDFFVDGGHNPQCAQTIRKTLTELYPDKKIIFLLGILKDKNYCGILEPLLPLAKNVITITPPSPRAMKAEELAKLLYEKYSVKAIACTEISDGVKTALKSANADDVVCACGSLYSIGEIRRCFKQP